MADQKSTIAFFGATGGCANSCLASALLSGYCCTALARSPTKLQELLHQRQVPESIIADNLVIIRGNVTDIDAVKKVLQYKDHAVNFIVCGIGGRPSFAKPLKPTLDNPTICQDAIRTILAAAGTQGLPQYDRKPSLAVISTTGLSEHGRDFPFVMIPLYHWALQVV